MLGDLAPRYRAFLRLPGVPRLLAMALVARMPIGTMSLAMLMHARALTGSLAVAGTMVGAYMAASALAAPVQGRIIDRRGPALVLYVTGVVSPLALLAILGGAWLALPTPALLALGALAGAFMPPISVLTRTVWRHRFADDAQRQTAYALDSVLIEFAFMAGPALVALLLAVAGATAAFAAAWAFTVLAMPMFLLSGALAFWRHEPDAPRRLLGPLTEPRLLVVYATTFLLTVALGLIEVGYPGFAIAAGAPALGGVLIAVNSAGSAAGGLAYGGMRFGLPVERQLPHLLLLMAVPLAVHAVTTSPWLLAALALVAGVAIAPSFTAVSMLVTTHAPARYATEAFTWSSTCIVAGIGAGNALGGKVAESQGAAGAFALSAAFAFAAGLCAFGVHRRPPKPAARAG
jgi:MFS family permease